MSFLESARAAPAATGRDPQVIDQLVDAISTPPTIFGETAATAAAHHDRDWWRLEAHCNGGDWPAVLALHAAVIAAWRTRHDPGGAA
jgi:hypothetical protein